jgi:hypothetical protein
MHSTIDHSWFQANTAQRCVGVLGSVIITILFLLQFQSELKNFKKNVFSSNNKMQLIWVPSLENIPKKEPIATNIKINQEPRKIKKNQPITSISIETPTESKVKIKEDVIISASAKSDVSFDETPKLVFDSKSIRRAYEESKTDIQKMAEASGKPLIKTDHQSQNDRFQSAANKAAKKDCIGPNSSGTGLLAIFIIPVMAAMDKCK